MIGEVRGIVLFCRDAEACRAWYERVGFDYSHGYHGMHWFRLGGGTLMLHPAEHSSGACPPTIHLNVDDVDALFAAVTAAGIEVFDHQQPGVALTGPVTREWGDREFELSDPEGHVWAFTQR